MDDFVKNAALDSNRLANPVKKVPFLGGVAYEG